MRTEAIFNEADECEKSGGAYIHIEQYGKSPAQVVMAGSNQALSGLIMSQIMKLAQMNNVSFLEALKRFKQVYKLNKADIDREIASGMVEEKIPE